jgi:hypothetical protein
MKHNGRHDHKGTEGHEGPQGHEGYKVHQFLDPQQCGDKCNNLYKEYLTTSRDQCYKTFYFVA